MRIALSPYHLTTREPPAMAALLLADEVVTLVPAPSAHATSATAQQAAARSPSYRELVKGWSWSTNLWKEGVLTIALDGETPADDMHAVAERLDTDPEFTSLRPLMRRELFESEERFLSLVGADLLKGGPDPAITVPIAAAIDRFASRRGLPVVRSEPVSVAQRAEARLGSRVFAIAIPIILQSSGDQIVAVREILRPELDRLRDAIESCCFRTRKPNAAELLPEAAREYADAFEREHEEIVSPLDDDDDRVVVGTVALTGIDLPHDAVLRSSVEAAGALVGRRESVPHGAAKLPVRSWACGDATVTSLVVRTLGSARRRS